MTAVEEVPSSMFTGDDIHVWRAGLDVPELRHRFFEVLSPDELERAGRFRFARDRERFVACRAMLRIVLGRYLEQVPAELEFAYGIHGKPGLKRPGVPPLCFNLSHSRGLALYAVGLGRGIGIDVEYIRQVPDSDRIVERYFPKDLNAAYSALPREARTEAFFKAWTCREAYAKATGRGLGDALENTECPSVRVLREDNIITDGWCFRLFQPAPGHIAAVAVAGDGCRLWSRHVDTAGMFPQSFSRQGLSTVARRQAGAKNAKKISNFEM